MAPLKRIAEKQKGFRDSSEGVAEREEIMSKYEVGNEVHEVEKAGTRIIAIDGRRYRCEANAEVLAPMLEESRCWHVSDEGLRARVHAALSGTIGMTSAEVDELIEAGMADPFIADEILEQIEQIEQAAEAKVEVVEDPVGVIQQANYAEHVALVVREKADRYLRVLDIILSMDKTEAEMAQAMEVQFGPAYEEELLAAIDELRVAGDVGRGRRLIEAISEASPSLFERLQRKYGCDQAANAV